MLVPHPLEPGHCNVLLLYLFQPMCDKIWPNCAIYDTNMIFGTHLDLIIRQIYDIGLSQISPLKALAAIF